MNMALHPFCPHPQRKVPAHLTLQLEDSLPYTLITPPSTSIPSHLLTGGPTTPITEATTPLTSPSPNALSDFMSLMNDTNYLQQVIANRMQLANSKHHGTSSTSSDTDQQDMAMYVAAAAAAASCDPLLGTDANLSNSLYLSPFAYDHVPSMEHKHKRADSQSSFKMMMMDSSGDESCIGKRKRDDDLGDELDSAELKRQTHIQSEQKRRAQIKDGFEELRHQLPLANLSTKKMSKATILANTVIYLQQLKASHQALTEELEKVQQENEQLRALHGNVFGV